MTKQTWGKSERSDWLFQGRDFPIRTVSIISRVCFSVVVVVVFVPDNKLLTNLASKRFTGKYWPYVVFLRTPLRPVCTATT